MAISREIKNSIRETLGEKFAKSNAAFIAEYRGLTNTELTELRRELKKVGSEFKILKNRVAIKAIEHHATDFDALKIHLKGPIGIAYVYSDVAAGAKALLTFAKDRENIKVKGGIFESKILTDKELKALSELPSREVLLSRILAALKSPHQGLVTVLNGVTSKMVRVINAIKETKSE